MATLAGLPILLPWFFSSTNVINWTKSGHNGFFTKVKLFIQQNSLGETINTSQKNNPDLIAEIPLSSLGKTNYYKYCLPKNSKLNSLGLASRNNNSECKLQYLSSSESKYEEISYLLESVTKFISTQHAINMLGFYEDKLWNVSDEVQSYVEAGRDSEGIQVNELSNNCNFSEQKATQTFFKDLFFKHKLSNKDCYISPSQADIHIVIPSSASTTQENLKKDQFSKGSMFGEISYGIFDYWAELKKIKAKSNQGAEININWPWLFSLEKKESTNECNWDSFWKLAKAGELRLTTIKSHCA